MADPHEMLSHLLPFSLNRCSRFEYNMLSGSLPDAIGDLRALSFLCAHAGRVLLPACAGRGARAFHPALTHTTRRYLAHAAMLLIIN
jgi:hypothetical protein